MVEQIINSHIGGNLAKLLFIGTARYSINICDFDLIYHNSKHEIVGCLLHESIKTKHWFKTAKYAGTSRDAIVTDLKQLPREFWSSYKELKLLIDCYDFDYICIGNGNDEVGLALQKDIKTNFLFSEYGWFPWNQCFFISKGGVGYKSDIAKMTSIDKQPDHSDDIESFKNSLNIGTSFNGSKFILVTLQNDNICSDGKPDFKYRFSQFKNNKEFLNHVRKITPKEYTILVKNHPNNKKPTTIPIGMIDISKFNLNKFELYSNMSAMMVINSTSVLEACLFDRPVITFGKCIFSNKNITEEDISSQEQVSEIISKNIDLDRRKRFANLLFERQINRSKCSKQEYINDHCWVNCI